MYMRIERNNCDLYQFHDGVVIISKLGTSYQLAICCSQTVGFRVYLHDECADFGGFDYDKLNMAEMITYYAEIEERSTWVISIPFYTKSMELQSIQHHLPKMAMVSVQRALNSSSIPHDFFYRPDLAIITGFCE